ncbi:M23 family metallopeptidase [Micromonospora sp. SL1-18]|uniref:M23 family metallopeptidase n=1 Tax=Micromonospora sp. SL1-18 TaxID=3399128 RepID=UPI003A4D8BA3
MRCGTVAVRPGELVAAGQPLGRCGNSGNSTQPHVHVQVMDDVDPFRAVGVPIVFRD